MTENDEELAYERDGRLTEMDAVMRWAGLRLRIEPHYTNANWRPRRVRPSSIPSVAPEPGYAGAGERRQSLGLMILRIEVVTAMNAVAFEGRCIPHGCVTPPRNSAAILSSSSLILRALRGLHGTHGTSCDTTRVSCKYPAPDSCCSLVSLRPLR
jgi:hypothetical protein